jgi:acetyl esterase/lipase
MNPPGPRRALIAAALLMSAATCSATYAQEAPLPQLLYSGTVTTHVYKKIGATALELDVYEPQGGLRGPAPVHVFIHGGGWIAGNRRAANSLIHLPVFEFLGARGVIGVSIDYRLVGNPAGTRVEDELADVRDALRYLLRDHARLGIDANRVVVWGSSAGGHLALLAALAPEAQFSTEPGDAGPLPTIRAVAAWFAPADLVALSRSQFGAQLLQQVLGQTLTEAADRYRNLSPTSWTRAASPPLLIMTGEKDTSVPPEVAGAMHRRALETGMRSEFVLVRGAGHQWRPGEAPLDPPLAEVQRRTAAFLNAALAATRNP